MESQKTQSNVAIKKSTARRFNKMLTAKKSLRVISDGRIMRRLARYRKELEQNCSTKGNRPLTPLEIAQHVNELLKYGVETRTTLGRLIKPRNFDYNEKELVEILRELHPISQLLPDSYRFAGISDKTLVSAGILEKTPAKRGPKPKKKIELEPTIPESQPKVLKAVPPIKRQRVKTRESENRPKPPAIPQDWIISERLNNSVV